MLGENQTNNKQVDETVKLAEGCCQVCEKYAPCHIYKGTFLCSTDCIVKYVDTMINNQNVELAEFNTWINKEFNLPPDNNLVQPDEVMLAKLNLRKVHQKWRDVAPLHNDATEEQIINEIHQMLTEQGDAEGKLIAAVARKIHPDAVGILGLYRSAVCLMPDGTLICYHDPGWMGEDVTVEQLPRFCEKYTVRGNRDHVAIVRYHEDASQVED